MSYESPIHIIDNSYDSITDAIEEHARRVAEGVDEMIVEACIKVGCAVDKDELVKALEYDRGQYEKGYADGKRNAAAAIEELEARLGEAENSVERWKDMYLTKHEPKRGEWEVKGANRIDCSVCGHSVCFAFGLTDGSFGLYKYCPNCGAEMEKEAEA